MDYNVVILCGRSWLIEAEWRIYASVMWLSVVQMTSHYPSQCCNIGNWSLETILSRPQCVKSKKHLKRWRSSLNYACPNPLLFIFIERFVYLDCCSPHLHYDDVTSGVWIPEAVVNFAHLQKHVSKHYEDVPTWKCIQHSTVWWDALERIFMSLSCRFNFSVRFYFEYDNYSSYFW